MKPSDIIAELHNMGVRFWAEGDKLKLDAPVGVITTALREELARHKKTLMKTLTDPRPGSIARPIPVRFNVEHPPRQCLIDQCGGMLDRRGELFTCFACGCWYSNGGALGADDMDILENEREFVEMSAMIH